MTATQRSSTLAGRLSSTGAYRQAMSQVSDRVQIDMSVVEQARERARRQAEAARARLPEVAPDPVPAELREDVSEARRTVAEQLEDVRVGGRDQMREAQRQVRQEGRRAREEARDLRRGMGEAAREGARGHAEPELAHSDHGSATTTQGDSIADAYRAPVDEAKRRALQASYRAGRKGRNAAQSFSWLVPLAVFVVILIVSALGD